MEDGLLLTRKQASLRRHRTLATLLLVFAAIVAIATELVAEPGFWILLVRAGAEAGVIGGLADWFAVTALFRRPLGLPIPHTGIIPRNKDRIGHGLGSFVERNFLAPELISGKLRESNAALRIGAWLGQPDNSRLIAGQIVALLPEVIASLQDREVRAFFRDAFRDQLRAVDLLPLIARLLRLFQESGQHQRLFERSLELARDMLLRNEATIYHKVEERTSWWIPRTIDRRMARAIIGGAEEMLAELGQPQHPARLDFEQTVDELIDKLEYSETFRVRVDEFKSQLLQSPEMVNLLESLWDELRRMLLARTADSPERLTDSFAASLVALANTLTEDADAQARLNRRLEYLLSGFVVPFRTQIGSFIAEVVQSWDAKTVSDRLELEVGRDLQYIRINGTLVGALAGCGRFLRTRAVF
jgi:uncharacterized membrane-anchored protein YjiN (DUF445 family)